MDAPVLAPDDQAGAFQNPQVLGHRGQRHPIRRGQFADGGLAFGEPGQDAAAVLSRKIAKGLDIVSAFPVFSK